jgi:hypothetical protein
MYSARLAEATRDAEVELFAAVGHPERRVEARRDEAPGAARAALVLGHRVGPFASGLGRDATAASDPLRMLGAPARHQT